MAITISVEAPQVDPAADSIILAGVGMLVNDDAVSASLTDLNSVVDARRHGQEWYGVRK